LDGLQLVKVAVAVKDGATKFTVLEIVHPDI
jgi:hypothetical protein